MKEMTYYPRGEHIASNVIISVMVILSLTTIAFFIMAEAEKRKKN